MKNSTHSVVPANDNVNVKVEKLILQIIIDGKLHTFLSARKW